MKVLLINDSPNEKGCTFTALSEVASTLAKTESTPRYSTSAKNPFRAVSRVASVLSLDIASSMTP